jgi:hypothetical protein
MLEIKFKMLANYISTIFTVYAFLFILLSHAALLACRYNEQEDIEHAQELLNSVGLDSLRAQLPK